jgi:hypothetical protein
MRYHPILACTLLCGLMWPSVVNNAQSQTAQSQENRIERLESRLTRLNDQVAHLSEVDRRWVGYGFYDESGLSAWSRAEPERLTTETNRPGVIRFRFGKKLDRRPIVIATPSNNWGNIRLERPSVRLVDVDESGFTVETYEESEPAYVKVFFAVFRVY